MHTSWSLQVIEEAFDNRREAKILFDIIFRFASVQMTFCATSCKVPTGLPAASGCNTVAMLRDSDFIASKEYLSTGKLSFI
jgi:hypothetical protein